MRVTPVEYMPTQLLLRATFPHDAKLQEREHGPILFIRVN